MPERNEKPARGDLMADPTPMLRIAGSAAVLGGILRLATPFTGMLLHDAVLHFLWVLTDFLLLLGTVGLFMTVRRRVGVPGMLSVGVAVFGILLVRSSAEHIFGVASYDVGATVWGLGQGALAALVMVGKTTRFRLACALWLGALALGLVGLLVPSLPDLWLEPGQWSGMVFAAGYVAAGVELLRQPASIPKLTA